MLRASPSAGFAAPSAAGSPRSAARSPRARLGARALARLPGRQRRQPRPPVHGTMERTGATIGATWVRDTLGFDGTGVGVAVIDSGVASWHDDLGLATRVVRLRRLRRTSSRRRTTTTATARTSPASSRATATTRTARRRGIAPGATPARAQGPRRRRATATSATSSRRSTTPSPTRTRFNIRVINLSVAAGVYESYNDRSADARRQARGRGRHRRRRRGGQPRPRTPTGKPQYGGITAPGNAPWVLTVGASSHNGTAIAPTTRSRRSARAARLRSTSQAKPDLVAPGVGIESLAEAGSTLFNTQAADAAVGHGRHGDRSRI